MTKDEAGKHYETAGESQRQLEFLLGKRAEIGITRVGDITGLDILDIPVMQVIRPLSRSNCVSQGKGRNATIAAISAVFESAETFFAERVELFDTLSASAKALGIPEERFSLHRRTDAGTHSHERWIKWVSAIDMISGAEGQVPFEMVHTAYNCPSENVDGIFEASTTGLAASFRQNDAIAHGIWECVERDAIARAYHTHGFFQRFRIDPSTIEDVELQTLINRLREKKMLVGLWSAPAFAGLHAVWCQLIEERWSSPILAYASDGSAARADLSTACIHAIYEAAQCRLTAISGAREDIGWNAYPKYPDWERIAAQRRLIEEGPQPIDFGQARDRSVLSKDHTVVDLVSVLERAGAESVYSVSLPMNPVQDIFAIKVIIPELMPLRSE